jgi:hypothetical protein
MNHCSWGFIALTVCCITRNIDYPRWQWLIPNRRSAFALLLHPDWLWGSQSAIQWVEGETQPGHLADHSLQVPKVTNEWSYTNSPIYLNGSEECITFTTHRKLLICHTGKFLWRQCTFYNRIKCNLNIFNNPATKYLEVVLRYVLQTNQIHTISLELSHHILITEAFVATFSNISNVYSYCCFFSTSELKCSQQPCTMRKFRI